MNSKPQKEYRISTKWTNQAQDKRLSLFSNYLRFDHDNNYVGINLLHSQSKVDLSTRDLGVSCLSCYIYVSQPGRLEVCRLTGDRYLVINYDFTQFLYLAFFFNT